MVKVQKKSKNAQALFEASACVKFDSILLALAKQITWSTPGVRIGKKGSDHLVRRTK